MNSSAKKAQFETLLKPLLSIMFVVALRYAKLEKDAEDLVAEAALAAWVNFDKLKDRKKFKPWILKILTNKYLSDYRKKKQGSEIPISKLENSSEDTSDFSLFDQLASPFTLFQYNPEKQFLDKLLSEDIAKAIDSLPQKYRLVFTLCELQSLSYEETADTLNIKVGTVRSRLHRAKSLLQRKLWDWANAKGYTTNTKKS